MGGDPHVLTFDGARPSFYGTGEFWIVKSARVKIQGRFTGTPYTMGLAATNKIAVSGAFIGDQTIEVGTMESGVTVGGGQFGTLTYDQNGELPDAAAKVFQRNIVHMDLPGGVTITVYRWKNYLDLRIKMPPQSGGQDGTCGNFNHNAGDDSTAQVFERVGPRVPQGELLFSQRVPVELTQQMQVMIARNCQDPRLTDAKTKCAQKLKGRLGGRAGIDSCVYDMCFGRMQHALRVAKTY